MYVAKVYALPDTGWSKLSGSLPNNGEEKMVYICSSFLKMHLISSYNKHKYL